MKNKVTDIYNGQNPIYESLKSNIGNINETKEISSEAGISSAMNTFFSILLNSKMENAKTVRGFQEIKNKILGTTTYGAFKQYIISVLQSLSAMDSKQKSVYDKNIQVLSDILSKFDIELGSNEKVFDSIKKSLLANLLNNFEQDLKKREEQMKKTNPKVFKDAVEKGFIVKEEKENVNENDEKNDEEIEEKTGSKAFNRSKESLDAAIAFQGEVNRDKNIPELKGNTQIEKYIKIADDLAKKAQDLQMIDRKGLKTIVTPTGEIKRGDYIRTQNSLINEIIRQKREYVKLKESILKIKVSADKQLCKGNKHWDDAKGICVPNSPSNTSSSIEKTTTSSIVLPCKYPIRLNTKCKEVGILQKKLISLIPSVKEFLNDKGGADNIYGKGTALAVNVIWGYLTGNLSQDTSSPLTKEMYDEIMKLNPEDIELTAINTSKVIEMGIEDKIEEKELIENTPVLSFDDFYSILEETYNFQKFDKNQQIFEQPKTTKKLKDECIKRSLDTGKIVDCGVKKTGETEKIEDTGDTGATGGMPTREEWKGLKYVQTGTYAVSFDESLLSAWGKSIAVDAASFFLPGSGLLLKAGTSGLRGLGLRFGGKIGAEKIAQKMTSKWGLKMGTSLVAKSAAKRGSLKTADILSRISVSYFNKYKKIPIPKRVASGVIGGTLGSAALEFLSGRNSFTIEVVDGYIDYPLLIGIKNGLVDTIDGYVSDDDWACISTILAIIKGAWTIDLNENPVSAWKVLKEEYEKDENESLISDIRSVIPKSGDVEGFPRLKASNPQSELQDVDWDTAYEMTINFLNKLEANESKLAENLKRIPKDYIEAILNGDFVEYDEEGNIEGMENEEETITKKDTSKEEETDSVPEII